MNLALNVKRVIIIMLRVSQVLPLDFADTLHYKLSSHATEHLPPNSQAMPTLTKPPPPPPHPDTAATASYASLASGATLPSQSQRATTHFLGHNGPECYVKPAGKSNRKLIRNALCYVCLAGDVNLTAKQRALAVSVRLSWQLSLSDGDVLVAALY